MTHLGMGWAFQRRGFESFADAVVRCCQEALDPGPMGDQERGDFYRQFISCGVAPAAVDHNGHEVDIGRIHTSCAIFSGAAWWWSGWRSNRSIRPGHPGWPMFGGWLGELDETHPAWVRWTGTETPSTGSMFFIQSTAHPNNCHVGIFIEETVPGVWSTAEGGEGGDGTRCSIGGSRSLDHFDRWGRALRGWWDASSPSLTLAPA